MGIFDRLFRRRSSPTIEVSVSIQAPPVAPISPDAPSPKWKSGQPYSEADKKWRGLQQSAMKHAKTNGRRLHFCGLLSDGGVHSHQNHLYALLRMAKQNGVERVFVHCFMDGRDTSPDSGASYIEQLQ